LWGSLLFLVGLFVAVTSVGTALRWLLMGRAPRPDGYVGRFRRPDGVVVHVARVKGRLMMASVVPEGVMPVDLGDVNGKELLGWERLATTPD
jgi:hypothetical protein